MSSDSATSEEGEDAFAEFDDSAPNWGLHENAVLALREHEGEGYASLLKGDRDQTEVSWDFDPLVLPSYVAIEGGHPSCPDVEDKMYLITNKNGKPTSFQILNPEIRTNDQPIGAVLGEVSERYAAVSYPVTFSQFAEMCNRRGWDWKITCTDQGKIARMDIIVAKRAELKRPGPRQVGDIYKFGLTIHNSLDGTGSLRVTSYAERLACTNGQVAMSRKALFTAKHTLGGIGSIDFEKFAEEVGEMIEKVKAEIILIERMKDIEMTADLFDRLQVEAARRGIITLPQAKPVIDEKTGKPIDYELLRGYGWKATKDAWENPDRPWVKVDGEDIGTAFQAYQALTGVLTWKPKWTGPATLNGNGNKESNGRRMNLRTLERRLHAVHLMMTDVLHGDIQLEKLPTTEQAIGIVAVN